VLASADRFSDRAILTGSCQVNTPASSSSVLLSRVALADQLPDADVRLAISADPPDINTLGR
jgi:hypothetical protein